MSDIASTSLEELTLSLYRIRINENFPSGLTMLDFPNIKKLILKIEFDSKYPDYSDYLSPLLNKITFSNVKEVSGVLDK